MLHQRVRSYNFHENGNLLYCTLKISRLACLSSTAACSLYSMRSGLRRQYVIGVGSSHISPPDQIQTNEHGGSLRLLQRRPLRSSAPSCSRVRPSVRFDLDTQQSTTAPRALHVTYCKRTVPIQSLAWNMPDAPH